MWRPLIRYAPIVLLGLWLLFAALLTVHRSGRRALENALLLFALAAVLFAGALLSVPAGALSTALILASLLALAGGMALLMASSVRTSR